MLKVMLKNDQNYRFIMSKMGGEKLIENIVKNRPKMTP
jgi:hypothetical protein